MKTNIIKRCVSLVLCTILMLSITMEQNSVQAYSDSDYQSLYNDILNGAKNYDEYVPVSTYNLITTEGGTAIIADIISEILYSEPEMFYLKTSFSVSRVTTTGLITKVILSYAYTKEEFVDMFNRITEQSQKFIALVDDSMTEMQKALVLHDALATNCTYDMGVYTGTEDPHSYDIYGVFINKKAVCQGYSLAYIYLLKQFNIEADMVTSDTMNHAWNRIKINNRYYQADVTWDDPTPDKLGTATHKYFLQSDAEFMDNSDKMAHSGYTTENPCTSTVYDDYFWKNISSTIVKSGNNWFYIDDKGKLFKTDNNFANPVTINTITEKWLYSTNSYYVDSFARIAEKDGVLYYNTNKGLYSINTDGTGKTLLAALGNQSKNQIFGIRLEGKYIYGSLSEKQTDEESVQLLYTIPDEVPTTVAPTTLPSISLYGDVNNDGKVSVKDATIIQRYALGLLSLSELQIRTGDVDGVSGLNINDVTYIQKYIVQIVTNLIPVS